MREDSNLPIKIRRIAIRNYKGIDEIELDFPPPQIPGDPDILVMGSSNGLGKTSIIECCALLLLAWARQEDYFRLYDHPSSVNVPDLLIKAGSHSADIDGEIVFGEKPVALQVRIDQRGVAKVSGDSVPEQAQERMPDDLESQIDNFIRTICGFTPNPILENTFLLFHSYRKVQEGNPELGMMVERSRVSRRGFWGRGARIDLPISAFKLRILRSMMGEANLFELVDNQDPDETIDKLNSLVQSYAGGKISKLRPSSDNTVDFRINPVSNGVSFSFDGLSSGQKEIISTLFLIWHHTKYNPSVIFIDEPELHLNAQWHRSLIKKLVSLAPQNQYIMATHSTDIMESVSPDRRILLLRDDQEGDE